MFKLRIFKKKRGTLIYGLSERGKKVAEGTAGRTDEGLILCALEEHGESSASEVASETHLDLPVVKHKLNRMRKQDLVKARAEEGEE